MAVFEIKKRTKFIFWKQMEEFTKRILKIIFGNDPIYMIQYLIKKEL